MNKNEKFKIPADAWLTLSRFKQERNMSIGDFAVELGVNENVMQMMLTNKAPIDEMTYALAHLFYNQWKRQ